MDTGVDIGPTIGKAAVWSGILNLTVYTLKGCGFMLLSLLVADLIYR